MSKNIVKAISYVVVSFLFSVAAVTAMVCMFYSTTFLPVYVGSTYVIGNQILRYAIYALLLTTIFFACGLIRYGINFLIRKIHKSKRRR